MLSHGGTTGEKKKESERRESDHVAAFSAFLDLYLAVYPAIVLWQLLMRRVRKLALSIALGLGAWYIRPCRVTSERDC